MLGLVTCPDITVANGASASNTRDSSVLSDAWGLVIMAPATLEAVTWVIQVSHDGNTWFNLNDGTNDIKAPQAGKAIAYQGYQLGAAAFFRLQGGGVVGADRIFKMTKQVDSGGA